MFLIFRPGACSRTRDTRTKAYNLRGQADYSLMKDKHAFNVLVGTEVISATTEADPESDALRI